MMRHPRIGPSEVFQPLAGPRDGRSEKDVQVILFDTASEAGGSDFG